MDLELEKKQVSELPGPGHALISLNVYRPLLQLLYHIFININLLLYLIDKWSFITGHITYKKHKEGLVIICGFRFLWDSWKRILSR